MSQIKYSELDSVLINKTHIVGADECGYGSLAGMLVVCAVRVPKDWKLEGLRDSKKLSPQKREALSQQLEKLIAENKIQWALAERSNTVIDQIGVYNALKDCYVEVLQQLYFEDTLIIIDGNLKIDRESVNGYTRISVPKADDLYPAVSAASVLAKVYRDSKMKLLHKKYPMYGWDHNMGYASKDHYEGIKSHGPCPLHRLSYATFKNLKLK
jgi:ribonuclease HII